MTALAESIELWCKIADKAAVLAHPEEEFPNDLEKNARQALALSHAVLDELRMIEEMKDSQRALIAFCNLPAAVPSDQEGFI